MNNKKTNNEKGAVLLETALALPFLLYITFMGFQLTRLCELQLAKRDIIRVLSLSHICGFRQPSTGTTSMDASAAVRCFNESINRVSMFTRDRFPQMQVYIQTYVIDNPNSAPYEASTRLASCGGSGEGSLPVTRVARSVMPAGFQSKFGLPGDLFTGTLDQAISNNFPDTRTQLCRNGQITIAEFNVNSTPLFGSLGGLIGGNRSQEGNNSSTLHYEFGAI